MTTSNLVIGTIRYGVNPRFEKEGNYGKYNNVKVVLPDQTETNVIVIPKDYESYTPGTSVVLEQKESGYYKITGIADANTEASASPKSKPASDPKLMSETEYQTFLDVVNQEAEKLADVYTTAARIFEEHTLFSKVECARINSSEEFRNLVVSLYISLKNKGY